MTGTTEWNASSYHQVSQPHVGWGKGLLESIELRGDELVIDAGCGTGRVTSQLLERLPNGRVIGIDRSFNMLEAAEKALDPGERARTRFVQGDLLTITPEGIGEPADLIFSTATFHWIPDHLGLFINLRRLLITGGQLVAQCGGGDNLHDLMDRASELLADPEFAPYFPGWATTWEFADAPTTESRLREAGYVDVEAIAFPAPTAFANADDYNQFLSTVIFGNQRLEMTDPVVKAKFIDRLTELAAQDSEPFTIDYWRLNLRGTNPER